MGLGCSSASGGIASQINQLEQKVITVSITTADVNNISQSVHLGIVAGVIDEMELVEVVTNKVGLRARETVSLGQVMKGMILNGLGFLIGHLAHQCIDGTHPDVSNTHKTQ